MPGVGHARIVAGARTPSGAVACVVSSTRSKFPSSDGHYMGLLEVEESQDIINYMLN